MQKQFTIGSDVGKGTQWKSAEFIDHIIESDCRLILAAIQSFLASYEDCLLDRKMCNLWSLQFALSTDGKILYINKYIDK